jgi:pilus assembly protein CpaC
VATSPFVLPSRRRGWAHPILSFCAVLVVATRLAFCQDLDFRIEHPKQRLEMIVNSSRIMSMGKDIPRMLVNNPDVVRVVPLSPTQVQVSALKPGVTQINLWDDAGVAHSVDVVVFRDSRPLEMILQSQFPNSAIRVIPTENSVILAGYVDRPEVVSSMVAIAADYYPNVINNISVGGVQQVLLHVKVMEVSRSKLRALGFDWAAISGDDFLIQGAAGLIDMASSTPSEIISTGQETVRFGIINDEDAFFGFIRALSERKLIKILAEPTLVSVSGRPASFNEGGEIPILVNAGLGATGVDFKEFGTRVDFVPIVLGNGNIRLEVRPEISEIDPSRGVTLNGINVPGIRSRFVDTAVEMRSGQTLALAGLIQRQTEAKKRGLPWLVDLPWTGNFFRSTDDLVNEIELLVVVTPHLVGALDQGQVPAMGPGQMTDNPNDCDFFGRGHIEVPRCCPDIRCREPGQPGPVDGSGQGMPFGHPMNGPVPGAAMPGGMPVGVPAGPMPTGPATYGPNPPMMPLGSNGLDDTYALPPGTTFPSGNSNPSLGGGAMPGALPSTGDAPSGPAQPELFGPIGYDDLD